MNAEEILDDLEKRLIDAAAILKALSREAITDYDRRRLSHKAQGVELALSFLREYPRNP